MSREAAPIHLKLPATSANLGPGFDALGLALDFALHVEADVATNTTITATGRNTDTIQRLDDSLLLATYRDILTQRGITAPELTLTLHNDIPLGMGCGSSAAALVAGVALAAHFGHLHWSPHDILTEASRREGHPDNVAACVLGGLTASAMQLAPDGTATVQAATLPIPTAWPILVALPQSSLSTHTARALLPDHYTKPDAIANVQAVALLTTAFATGRSDLLRTAMADRMHQPYRAAACPLLPALLPLAGTPGILGVALSGAGPSVLLVLDTEASLDHADQQVHSRATHAGLAITLLRTSIAPAATLS